MLDSITFVQKLFKGHACTYWYINKYQNAELTEGQ